MKNRIIALLAFVVLAGLNTYAQLDEPWEVTWPETLLEPLQVDNTRVFRAIDRVVIEVTGSTEFVILPEGHIGANPIPYLKTVLQLDNDIVVPLEQVYDSTFPDPSDSYQIDSSLPVGQFDGTPSVTHNGAGNYSLKMPLPIGVNGLIPSLGMNYNSNSPNGMLGVGWNLTGTISSITRSNRNFFQNGVVRSVELSATDALQIDGAQLVLVQGGHGQDGATYSPENDPTTKVVLHGVEENQKSFEVFYSDGRTAFYGETEMSSASRFDSEDGQATLVWSLSRIQDRSSNYIEFDYKQSGRAHRLSSIKYTGNETLGLEPINVLSFTYSERGDVIEYFIQGNLGEQPYLLKRIDISVDGAQHSAYELSYALKRFSYLTAITKFVSNGTALNPTKFFYGQEASSELISTDYVELNAKTAVVATLDFNNDGLSDIFKFTGGSGTPLSQWHILTSDGVGGFSEYASGVLSSLLVPIDYNGDGHLDLASIGLLDGGNDYQQPEWENCTQDDIDYYNTYNVYPNCVDYYQQLRLSTVDVMISNQDGTFTTHAIMDLPVPEFCNPQRLIYPGDFNGNGRSDLLLFYGNNPSPGDIAETGKLFTYDIDAGTSSEHTVDMSFLGKLTSCEKVDLTDFNGNGKLDFLLIPDQSVDVEFQETTIVEIQYQFNSSALEENILFVADPANDFIRESMSEYKLADLTADGKTDVLFQDTDGWKIARSDGKSFREELFGELESISNGCDVNIRHIGDFNSDGITDIMFDYHVDSGSCTQIEHGLLYGSGSGFHFREEILQTINDDCYYGDFNGDGATDWLYPFVSPSSQWKQVTLHRSSFELMLHHVDNGFVNRFSFEYRYSTDSDFLKSNGGAPSIVNGKVTGDPNSIRAFSNPLRAVRRFTYPLVNGGTSTTEYRYTHPVAHTQGKGFLGFRWRTSYDHNSSIKTQDFYGVNEHSESFELISSYSAKFEYVDNATFDVAISETTIQEYLSGWTPGIKESMDKKVPKRYIDLPKVLIVNDYTAQSTARVENTYQEVDSDGGFGVLWGVVIDQTTSKTGELNFNLGEEVETAIIDTDHESTSDRWWAPFVVTSTTTTSTRHTPLAGGTHNRVVEFEYDNLSGLLNFQISDPNTAFEIRTDYLDYNATGQPERILTTSSGLNDVEQTFSFDPTFRFIDASTNDLGETTTFKNESVFGLVTETIDYLDRVDRNEYDELGRVIKNINPLGLSTDYLYDWVNSSPTLQPSDHLSESDILFKEEASSTEMPTAVTQYDRFGNQRRTYSEDIYGNLVYEVAFFDDRGRVIKASEPFFDNQPSILFSLSEFNDVYDRVTSTWVEDAGGNTISNPSTYIYDITPENYVTGTVKRSDGTSSTTYTDGTGKIVKVEDEGGMLNYTYYSDHNLRNVENDGQLVSLRTYDLTGNRASLYGPNSDLMLHTYDAYGRVLSQQDAKSNRFEFTYDPDYGRLIQKDLYENYVNVNSPILGSYVYSYVTEGNGLNSLQSVTSPDGFINSYTYDALGRTDAKIENIDDEDFTTKTSYDDFGRISSITHADGTEIDYSYNERGYLTQMSHGANALWSIGAVNARGQIEGYTYGNGISTTEEFDIYGLPTRKYTSDGVTQDLEYGFNHNSGNLDWRADHVANRKDVFEYDGQNRLTGFEVVIAANDAPILPDISFGYLANGNIDNSSWLGNYSYQDPVKINAVTLVDDPDNILPQDNQHITYNGFNSISHIENLGVQLVEQDFYYSSDEQRSKVVTKIDGYESKTMLYAGAYERKVEDGNEIGVLYINTPSGSTAMFVTDNGATTIKFLHTDHLGSLVAVTDEVGQLEARQSFDAWGRHRDPVDWSYYSNDPYADGSIPDWLWRGYTGHEHMTGFDLINMNGRLYDPLVGRMLSPDNYVQSPMSTQGYNRYTYAKNNPLKYTDPDGEFLGLVITILVVGIVDHVSGVPPSRTFNKIVALSVTAAFGGAGIFATSLTSLGLAAVMGAAHGAMNPSISFAEGVARSVAQTIFTAGFGSLANMGVGALGIGSAALDKVAHQVSSNLISGVIGAGMSGASFVTSFVTSMAISLSTSAADFGYDPVSLERQGYGIMSPLSDPNLIASNDPGFLLQTIVVTPSFGQRMAGFLDVFQTGLDLVGLIPGIGEIADGLNAGIYLARGDYSNAALSAAAMVPIAGAAVAVAKLSTKLANRAAKGTKLRSTIGAAKKSYGNIKQMSDGYLKKNGIDAHQVKAEALGTNKGLSRHDIYRDNGSRELMVFRKGGAGDGIHTDIYFD